MILEKVELYKAPINSTYLNVLDFRQTYSSTLPQDINEVKGIYKTKFEDYFYNADKITVNSGISNSVKMSKNFELTLNIDKDFFEVHEYSYCIITSGGKLYFYFIEEIVEDNSINKYILSLSWDAWANNYPLIKNIAHNSQYITRRHIDDTSFTFSGADRYVMFKNDYRCTDEGELSRTNSGLFVAENCQYRPSMVNIPKLDILWLKIGVDRTMIHSENVFSDPVAPTQSKFTFEAIINRTISGNNINYNKAEVELYDDDFLKVMQGETLYLYVPLCVQYQGNIIDNVKEKVTLNAEYPDFSEYDTVEQARNATIASRQWKYKRISYQQVPGVDQFNNFISLSNFNIQDIVGGVVTEASLTYNAPFYVMQMADYVNGEIEYTLNVMCMLYGFAKTEFLGVNGSFMKGAVMVPFAQPFQLNGYYAAYSQATDYIIDPFEHSISHNDLIVYSNTTNGKLLNNKLMNEGFLFSGSKQLTSKQIYDLWAKKVCYPYTKLSLCIGDAVYELKPYNNQIYMSFTCRRTGEGIEYKMAEFRKIGDGYYISGETPFSTYGKYSPKTNFTLTSTEFTDKAVRQPISTSIELIKPAINAAVAIFGAYMGSTTTTVSSAMSSKSKSPHNLFKETKKKLPESKRAVTTYKRTEIDTGYTQESSSQRKSTTTRSGGRDYIEAVAEGFNGSTDAIKALSGNGSNQRSSSTSAVNDALVNDRILFIFSQPLDDEISAQSIALETYYSGYEYNQIGNIHDRFKLYYDYIQTQHVQLPLIVDQEDRATIQEIFDRGVTIWNMEQDIIESPVGSGYPLQMGVKNIFNIKEETQNVSVS